MRIMKLRVIESIIDSIDIFNVVKDEENQILTKCVDKFLNFLDDQRVEAIFDKKSIEIQFKATAETLSKMIDKGENV